MDRLEGRFQEVLEDDSIIVVEYLFEERDISHYSYTNGLRYKLVLIIKWATEESVEMVLLYDNFHESEPHIHIRSRKNRVVYEFRGIENLLLDFLSEVKTLTGLNIEDWIKELGQEVLNSPFKKFW
ncbi:DUF6516 family protein [Desulfurobacterium sp. TC5-1]|uniref:toxin-antitoxin system TumE family protein n=1 Tax=Desulfurobacterium sp. TC5-1 TaxID=1158318 RepID=UPI0003B4935F|nr:DUF6516 family protein [Desulfurobacterium sp. TC5-1]